MEPTGVKLTDHVFLSDRKSSSKSVKKEQAEARTAMAEPAYTVPEFRSALAL